MRRPSAVLLCLLGLSAGASAQEPPAARAPSPAQEPVDCDVFLSVGTSSLVYPAAGLAEVAAGRGAVLVEVNPNRTDLTDRVRYALHGPSGTVLPALLRLLDSPAT